MGSIDRSAGGRGEREDEASADPWQQESAHAVASFRGRLRPVRSCEGTVTFSIRHVFCARLFEFELAGVKARQIRSRSPFSSASLKPEEAPFPAEAALK